MARLVVVTGDKDGDSKQLSIAGEDAATDGSDYAAKRTLAASLLAAIQATQRQGSGALKPTKYWAFTAEDTELEPSFSTFTNSTQTNNRWLVEYIVNGVADEKKHIPIPCANEDHADAIVANGRIELPITSGIGAALKTAIEAFNSTYTVEAIFRVDN